MESNNKWTETHRRFWAIYDSKKRLIDTRKSDKEQLSEIIVLSHEAINILLDQIVALKSLNNLPKKDVDNIL